MGHLGGRFGIFGKWIFWMTLLYLVCELAFSASLLDLCSREASMADIDALEKLGRSLTGVAVALFFIGVFIDKDEDITLLKWKFSLSPAVKIGMAVAYVMVCTLINTVVQDWVVDNRIKSTYQTPQDRKNAFLLTLAGRSLANGTLHITSIDRPEVLSHSPSMKAFVAIFPALAFNYPDVQKDINKLLYDAIALNVMKTCDDNYDVQTCLGTAEQFNNNAWPKIVRKMEGNYAQYIEKYNEAVRKTSGNELNRSAIKVWDTYVDVLKSKYNIHSLQSISSNNFRIVRDYVKRAGIPVPNNWSPHDRETFLAAAKQSISHGTWSDFGKEFGLSEPTKFLLIGQFVKSNKSQMYLRTAIGIADPTLTIPLVTKFEDVKAQVYEPIAKRIILKKQKEAQANPDSFMGMTDLGRRTDTAVKSLVVVPLALLMSLLGGFGHAVKLLTITSKNFLPGSGRKQTASAIGLASLTVFCAIVFMYLQPNPLIDTNAYQMLASGTSGRGGAWYELGLEFIVRLQEFVYPVNAKLLEYRTVLVLMICAIGLPLVIKDKLQPPSPPVR